VKQSIAANMLRRMDRFAALATTGFLDASK